MSEASSKRARPWLAASVVGALLVAAIVLARVRNTPGTMPASSPRVAIAAASDLRFALDDVVRAFEARESAPAVAVTYGSSGNFFAQLSNEAPFDVFLSADVSYPRKLAERGLGLDPVFVYAIGRIVVWVPKESPVDVERLGIQALLEPTVKRIAIANPAHAPYGRAAEAAMTSLGILPRAKDKLVLGDNIAQTAQFVDSGAADAGIIALSLALAPSLRSKGRFWQIPDDAYPRLEQGGVILRGARDPEAARSFQRFFQGPEARAILERYGFAFSDRR